MGKRLLWAAVLVLAASIFAACSSDLPNNGAQDAVETVTGGDSLPPEAALMAQQALADQLAATSADVEIISSEQVDWPNACLGLPDAGEACAEVITPGFLVTLQVNGEQYQVRTDETGNNIRFESSVNN